jgi:transposase
MARALSVDLRHRVLRAMREGISAHAAAERFGIALATAVRWRALDRSGRAELLPMGADRRSGRIEAEASFLLSLIEGKIDITLHEMRRRLAAERGLQVGVGTLWRFFDPHGQTWKKDSPCQQAGATRPSEAARGLV